jgi:hypothetical protein
MREVWFVDGLAVKLRRHDGSDLRQGVEPCHDLFAWLAVLQAAVDLLADGLREPCDFSISGHRIFFGLIHLNPNAFRKFMAE